jgi:LysM repeat protein
VLGALEVAAVGIRLTTTFPDPATLPEPGAPRSATLLFADAVLPTVPPDHADIAGPLLFGDYVWPLQVLFEHPLPLEGGIKALLAIVGVSDAGDFALPPGIAPINLFGLSDVGFGIKPVTSGLPGLDYVSVGIASTEPWDPPIAYLTFENVGTRWAFTFHPNQRTLVVGTIFGTMRFGQKTGSSLGAMAPHAHRVERGPAPRTGLDDVLITVQLSLPDLAFSAFNEEPFDIPIDEAFRAFFGGDVPHLALTVQSLSVYASFRRKEFEAGLVVGGDLSYTAGKVTLSLTALELQANVSQSTVSGRLQGKAQIAIPNATPIELLAQAEYPGTGAWEFLAVMNDSVDLPRLVYGLMGEDPPQWVKDIAIELADLELRYNTGPGSPYSASGTLRTKLSENLLGITMQLEVTVRVQRALRTSETEPFAIARRDTPFVDPATVLTGSLSGSFTVGKLIVKASVSVSDAGKDYTFAVTYRDVSLTAATSWIVSPPNTPRHQIVTIRLTGTLGDVVTYLVSLANPNANFRLDPPWDFLNSINLSGLALVVDPKLQSVAVTYDIKLDLGFVTIDSVGLRYDRSGGTPKVEFVLVAKMLGDGQAKPVTWDAVNQSPPSVAGLGSALFDLRYVGLGQHISPKDLTQYTDITSVVDALVAAMRPVDPAKGKPPIDPAKMRFDPSSQWLFGIDAKFMDTVALKLVFHDPDLYGILFSLSGPMAQSLAGLSVELLYKKVTDDIGVFHARLQLPDAFRKLQFGAVSVTLGILTVDIYTNGNFRVDLGFPHDRDWSPCFAVEITIFNGRGGLYFGLLNGATSNRVPRITNGTFSPVIELGVGLSIGLGRTFEKGPLKAGLYVNLVVIFEGALAWFHPDDANQGTSMYYWCRGTAGILGKIYGSVDFKIIAVDVSIEISAMATLELTAYRATTVDLELSVRANASVKILFFRISFSFSLTLRTSFILGSDTQAPWRQVPGTAPRPRLASLAALDPAPQDYKLRFDKDAKVFPDGQFRTAHLALAPAYTIAEVPVDWTGGAVPPNPDPEYRLVVMLVTDNAVPVDAVTIADTQRPDVSHNAHATTASDTSFNLLTEGLFRWSLDALGITSPTATVSLADLTELVAQLALVEAANEGFTWDNIEGFLTNNVHVEVRGTPATREDTSDESGTPFPMIPALSWTSTDLPDPDQRERKFWEYQPVDATYEAEALAYFAKLDPRPPEDRPSVEARLAWAGDPTESMTRFVLRDYVRLIARTATQAAVDLLTSFPHVVASTDSLGSIARTYGVDPEAVALANPDWPVVAGATVHLGTLPVQVVEGDTIASLAQTYSADVAAWLAALATTTPLLRPGATMPLPGFRPAGLSVDDTAAVFYVRLGLTRPEAVPLADWYEAAITRLNPGDPLPEGLVVPTGYQQTTTTTWDRLAGDTVLDVAAYLALVQNVVPGTPFATWLDAVRAANQPPGPDVALPADAAAVILENDTLATLRARLLLDEAAFAGYATRPTCSSTSSRWTCPTPASPRPRA